jgi:hypothetical protein
MLIISVVSLTIVWRHLRVSPSRESLLNVVKDYADAMIEHGRDRYGSVHSPLFAASLDRQTLSLLEGESLKKVTSLPRAEWGIRNHDRALTGANPMQHTDFYQVLYGLSDLTGDEAYSIEANQSLRWFFENCQSDVTGLMPWGEHSSWDFFTENVAKGKYTHIHEFTGPWFFYRRTVRLTPEAAERFARGLWEHQIADHKTGDFSRHANIFKHGPGRNNQYPRHGGFYIAVWAEAFAFTSEQIYLTAIKTLLGFYESHKSQMTGAIPAEIGNPRSKNKLLWPHSNLSLAIDLWDAAPKVPDHLGERMRMNASQIDRVFLKIPHNPGREGKGFVTQSHVDSLTAIDIRKGGNPVHSKLWATGYGQATHAQIANLLALRYSQRPLDRYRDLILLTAQSYLQSEPNIDFPVYPGTMGHVIELMLTAHRLTDEEKYLKRANCFAERAMAMFFDASSPLPKASSRHSHYEAITRCDALMCSLLKLWARRKGIQGNENILFTDR